MSEIDFLGHKKNSENEKTDAGETKPDVAWSEPEKQARAAAGAPFSFLPFKNKPKPAAADVSPKVDNNKIKQSRQEILRLIKYHENSKPPVGKSKNFLSALGDKIKKQPSHKEVLVDYQRVFNREKEKKNQTGRVFSNAPAALRRPPRLVASPESSWFDDFKGLFKRLLRLRSVRLSSPKSGQGKKIAPSFGAVKIISKEPPEKKPEVKPVPKVEAPIIAPQQEEKKEAMEVKQEETKLPEKELNYQQEERGQVLETNLINEEIVTFFDWQEKIIPLASAILASIVAAAAIYYGIAFYQKSNQSKNLEQAQKFQELEKTIALEEPGVKEINVFGGKLKIVSQIFAQHLYWTNFFKFLEDNIIKNVYFTDFSGDTSGNYSLNALASSYGDIDQQVMVLKNNKDVTKVEVSGGEMVGGDEINKTLVKFILKFSISKKIFTE